MRGIADSWTRVSCHCTMLLRVSYLLAISMVPSGFTRAVSPFDISWDKWNALNTTVQGRLHFTLPLALPCFSSFNDADTHPDPTACAVVQGNYTDATFRSGFYSARMIVSDVVCASAILLRLCSQTQWETCQATGAGCLLDDSDPANPLAYEGKSCDTGNLPSLHVRFTAHKPDFTLN